MDIKSGEELDRRTATVRINVPKERYWPKGWQRPAEYPTFQAVEIGDNRLGMEVRQDGTWVRLPDQAALHIRVMTVQVAELRDMLEEIDAEFDRQLYNDPAVKSCRNIGMDIVPDYEHHVVITEALRQKIARILNRR
jgi:hypothetical protein